MNVIDLLITDHRLVDKLFDQFKLADAKGKREIANEFTRQLSMHASTEEAIVYPFMKNKLEKMGGETIYEHCLDDHQHVKIQLEKLASLDVEDPQFELIANDIITSVRQHVLSEENDYFAKMRNLSTEEELQGLATKVKAFKLTAPTHPHSMAPNKPPMNILGAPGLKAMDVIADTFKSFPEKLPEVTPESSEKKATSLG